MEKEIGKGQRYVDMSPGSFGRYRIEDVDNGKLRQNSDIEMRKQVETRRGAGFMPTEIGIGPAIDERPMPNGYGVETSRFVYIKENGENGVPRWVVLDSYHNVCK
jgi:hypothetical protein